MIILRDEKNLEDRSIDNGTTEHYAGYLLEGLIVNNKNKFNDVGDLQNAIVAESMKFYKLKKEKDNAASEYLPEFTMGPTCSLLTILQCDPRMIAVEYISQSLARCLELTRRQFHEHHINLHKELLVCKPQTDDIIAKAKKFVNQFDDEDLTNLEETVNRLEQILQLYDWAVQHAGVISNHKEVRLLIRSDSVGAGVGVANFEHTWINLLRTACKKANIPCKIINLSIGGNLTRHGAEDVESAIDLFKPNVIACTLGGNDALASASVQTIQKIGINVKTMFEIAKKHSIPFLWSAGIPGNEYQEDIHMELDNKDITLLKNGARSKIQHYDELYNLHAQLKNTCCEIYTSPIPREILKNINGLPAHLDTDNVHLTEYAHSKIAVNAFALVSPLLSEIATNLAKASHKHPIKSIDTVRYVEQCNLARTHATRKIISPEAKQTEEDSSNTTIIFTRPIPMQLERSYSAPHLTDVNTGKKGNIVYRLGS